MTQNPPHNTADDLCGHELVRVLPPGWYVRVSKPVRLPPSSMPEPDRCVVRGGIRDYARRDPGPAEIGLAVEVGDSSLDEDRLQAAIYGSASIPVYWIVNVVDRQVEVYSGPTASGYAQKEIYVPGRVVPIVLDGCEVGKNNVDSILP
jgi:Uma2 family endonuclease